ncbi:MAG: hypothetical protein OEV31_03830 [Gammaproteobacteria bacterium]|nr:hypothetical protein [Gammaproteobacteria bacterium]
MSNNEKSVDSSDEHSKLWSLVVVSYAQSVLRAGEAQLLSLLLGACIPALASGLSKVAPDDMKSFPEELQSGLSLISRTKPKEYDAFRYVAPLSFLVYYVSLFDTFLQDTIEFLLCLHPNAIGDSHVDFQDVLKAGTRDDVLNTAIRNKVREIGFLSFSERLQWLRKRFGLNIALTEKAQSELSHYANVRNTVVHDQGYFDFRIVDGNRVVVQQRGCPRHPTVITHDNVVSATNAFSDAVVLISQAVFEQVLKTNPHDAVKGVLDVLRKGKVG